MNSLTTIHSNIFSRKQQIQNFRTVSSFTIQITGTSATTTSQTKWIGFNGTGQYVVLTAYDTPPTSTDYKTATLWVSTDYGVTFVQKNARTSQSPGNNSGYGNRQASVNRYGFIAFAVNQNTGDGGMYLSTNAGNTFTRNNVLDSFLNANRMQGSSINNTNIHTSIVCYAGCNFIGIYKRTFRNGFPDTNTFQLLYDMYQKDVGSFRIASDLVTQNVIYNTSAKVYSTNSGTTWNSITATSPINPPNQSRPAIDFYISPRENMFFAAGYYYYYLSTTSFTSGWSNISSRFLGLSTYQNNNNIVTPFACTGDNKYIAIAQWFPTVTNGIYNNTVQCFISSDYGNTFTAIKVFDASTDPQLAQITMTYYDNYTPKRILITANQITNIYYIDF
jgi:hypothetical protein